MNSFEREIKYLSTLLDENHGEQAVERLRMDARVNDAVTMKALVTGVDEAEKKGRGADLEITKIEDVIYGTAQLNNSPSTTGRDVGVKSTVFIAIPDQTYQDQRSHEPTVRRELIGIIGDDGLQIQHPTRAKY